MRLWPILLVLTVLAFAGAARATDYQIIWHQRDLATLVDTGTMRETGQTRQVETLDVIWSGDHPTAYRHRLEVDCAGERARMLAARSADLKTDASWSELEAPLYASKAQGWYAPVLGTSGGRLLEYMCRPVLAEEAARLVRNASPTEAVLAYTSQWCNCERDERLPKDRWKVWQTIFDDMGLPHRSTRLEGFLRAAVGIGVLLGVPLLIHLTVARLRPVREGEVRVADYVVSLALICLAASGGIAWAGSYAWQGQEIPITLLVLGFGLGGLALLPYWLCFRVLMTPEGFTYRDYWGRSSTWRWTEVEAVGVRDGIREVHLRMTGGRILKFSFDLQGMDPFFPHIEKAKGWAEGGPVAPVTF